MSVRPGLRPDETGIAIVRAGVSVTSPRVAKIHGLGSLRAKRLTFFVIIRKTWLLNGLGS